MKNTKKTAAGMPIEEYVICRGYRSGVHAGTLEKIEDGWIYLRNARRIWYWNGAGSLSELAVYGPNPKTCSSSKIGVVVPRQRVKLEDVSEIIVCEAAGATWLREVSEWRA